MARLYTHTDIQLLLALDATRSQGTVTRHVSGNDDETDLEYRGTDGKWTLATVDNTNQSNPEYLTFLWNHGVPIIRQLLASLTTQG